jgi:alkylation response protein AidB-like acyl-CoA dehydrogenase
VDFSFSEDQQAVIDLAAKLLGENATHERQREIERGGGTRFDRELWAMLAEAGLVGTALPQEHGGAGLGFLEVASILEQAGRTTAPVPFHETVVLGALPIAAFGSTRQRAAWLPRVASGEAILTAALMEDGADPGAPATEARAAGPGVALHGEKVCVPFAEQADAILVPARGEDGRVAVYLLDPTAPGVALTPLVGTSGRPQALLRLDGARVGADAVLGGADDGARVLPWLLERATAGLCALTLGVCARALELTAEYVKTRKQFGQPIAMFQAVGHRAADAYVDLEGIRLTTWQAAWRLDAGLPAAAEVALAKFWAADAGQRIVHAAQHLHGGMGVDRDYPLHRCFLWAKELELALGGATPQLLHIGRLLAEEAA